MTSYLLLINSMLFTYPLKFSVRIYFNVRYFRYQNYLKTLEAILLFQVLLF
nr:MAG TPA: hypothetical protein [Caudoviricetes sp.]